MYLGCSSSMVWSSSHSTSVFFVARRLLRQHCICRVRLSLVLLCFLPFYHRSHLLCLLPVLVDKRLQRLTHCLPLRFMHLPSSSFTLLLGLGLRFRLLLTCPLVAHSVLDFRISLFHTTIWSTTSRSVYQSFRCGAVLFTSCYIDLSRYVFCW